MGDGSDCNSDSDDLNDSDKATLKESYQRLKQASKDHRIHLQEYDRNDSTLLSPNGYLQSEEFRKIQSQSINKYLNENILELKKSRNDSSSNNFNNDKDDEGASKLVFENQHHDELSELFDNFKKI